LKDGEKEVFTLGTKDQLGPRTYKLVGVTSNRSLVASFLKVYTITSSASGSGTISPATTFTVDSGSTQAFTLTSGSPTTGVFVSSLFDNGANLVANLTGDPMNTSTYTLAGISANHTISATFAIKTFTLTVNGLDLCVTEVCPTCIPTKCLAGQTQVTRTVNYGETWRIRTDDSSGTLPFRTWSGGPPTATTNPDTVALTTGNATYTALYGKIIIDPCPIRGCVVIDDPIIMQPISSESAPVSPSASQATPVISAPKED
jgi:hypothetical protein